MTLYLTECMTKTGVQKIIKFTQSFTKNLLPKTADGLFSQLFDSKLSKLDFEYMIY